MDFCEAQDLVRWAAPPSWPNDIVVRVTGLLCDGRSVRSTARAVKVQRESVARVRRVLRAAGARLGRSQLNLRLPTSLVMSLACDPRRCQSRRLAAG
jgi:hypothetical protein